MRSCQAHGPLPDPSCTPGVTNPAVIQENIFQTICVAGWTRTIRPPVSYTNALKFRQMAEYGIQDLPTSAVEEDHLIPLVVGGIRRTPATSGRSRGTVPTVLTPRTGSRTPFTGPYARVR